MGRCGVGRGRKDGNSESLAGYASHASLVSLTERETAGRPGLGSCKLIRNIWLVTVGFAPNRFLINSKSLARVVFHECLDVGINRGVGETPVSCPRVGDEHIGQCLCFFVGISEFVLPLR